MADTSLRMSCDKMQVGKDAGIFSINCENKGLQAHIH